MHDHMRQWRRRLTGKGEMSGSLSLDFRHFGCSTEGEKAKTDDDEMKRCSNFLGL